MKVWVIEILHCEEGYEVVAVLKSKPTHQKAVKLLKKYVLGCFEVRSSAELKEEHGITLRDELRNYRVCDGFRMTEHSLGA